ncbi:MAG: adenylate cyclase [Granulosicoccus sp.]|jgi:adenylate cyclase
MKLPPQIRLNLGKVLIITVVYALISLFVGAFFYVVLNSPFSLGPSELYDAKRQVFANLFTSTIAGIVGGSTLVFVNGSVFQKRPFYFSIIIASIMYVFVFGFGLLVNVSLVSKFWRGANVPFDQMIWVILDNISEGGVLVYFILWGAITIGTLFFLQVNDKFGPGILIKFLRGQYHSPKDEQRIFMFLDMRSSTSIAEKIGHHNYFNLLRDLFADITPTILKYDGEIYQYVGDEIVLSWPLEKGLKNANCVKCFMEIEAELKELAAAYDTKYGCSPEFKAGLHFGQVTAGEVGVIKKDIIYSGDVLNTAARIQGQCNHYKVNLLLSDELFHLLEHKNEYELISIGSIELRGKQEKVSLSTLKVA